MAKLLKDLYNKEYITLLSDTITKHHKVFDKDSFIKSIFNSDWENKELKQRMRHISITLGDFLSTSYTEALKILKKTFLDMNYSFSLENLIFQDFVEVYGLEYYEISIKALECFTINSSSEFAIRQFILKYPQKSIVMMLTWAKNKNEHIRRLASEGSRPRLPWGIALQVYKNDPTDILPILEILKEDESLYVRKSVANNLNDISKDNPKIVKNIAKRWFGKNKNTDWILKHGCRTLLKQSDRDILSLFGYSKRGDITIDDFRVTKNVKKGSELQLSFTLRSKNDLENLRIEYAIDFVRQNNKYSKKVFQIAKGNYTQKSKSFQKTYSFKQISTRKYYSGTHHLSIILNGVVVKNIEFYLGS